MKIKNFKTLSEQLTASKKMRIVIAGATREEIQVAKQAHSIASFIFIGDEKEIHEVMEKERLNQADFDVVDVKNHKEIAKKAIEMIHSGQADIPMKGLIHTSTFMSAVLNKETGLKRNGRLSQITLFEYDKKLKFLTDCAINIDLDLQTKQALIENAVSLAHTFGIESPNVALLGAVETVGEKMPDTLDSAILTQMNRRGQIKNCLVDGPLSLDNAISRESAMHKGIVSEVAGNADILVGSSLQEANTLSKSLNFYAGLSTASVIMGTKQPIIMTSRTDKTANKVNSIAATCYYLKYRQDEEGSHVHV